MLSRKDRSKPIREPRAATATVTGSALRAASSAACSGPATLKDFLAVTENSLPALGEGRVEKVRGDIAMPRERSQCLGGGYPPWGHHLIWVAGSTILGLTCPRRLLPSFWLQSLQSVWVLASVSGPPRLWGMMWSTSALLGSRPCSQLRKILHRGQCVSPRSWSMRLRSRTMRFHWDVPVREVANGEAPVKVFRCDGRCRLGRMVRTSSRRHLGSLL